MIIDKLRNEIKCRLKEKTKKWETGKGDRHEIRSIRATLTVMVNTKLRRGLTSPIRKRISIPCSCDFSGSPRAKRKRVVYEELAGWHWPQVGVLLSFHFYLVFRTYEFVIYLTIKWHGTWPSIFDQSMYNNNLWILTYLNFILFVSWKRII